MQASGARRLEVGGNGSDGTGRNTLFTNNTAAAGEMEAKLPVQGECLGGANPCTETTVNTAVRINEDFSATVGNLNAAIAQPCQRRRQLIHIPGQFHHQLAHLIGSDLRPDDVGSNIKVLGQAVGDGHVYHLAGKGEGDPLFHGRASELLSA
jgi:hypothetical protein